MDNPIAPILSLVRSYPVFSLLTLVMVYLLYMILPATRSPIQFLPLPPDAKIIWGHEKEVYTNQPGRAFRNWINRCGPTFRMKAAFGAPDILVLSDPIAITYILQKKVYDYHHSAVVRPRIARLLGKGLGWIEGEDAHKRMRRLAMPALTADNIKAMSSDVMDAAGRVITDLLQVVNANGNKAQINMVEWTGKATLNVVGRVAFLHDFEAGNSHEAQDILNARKSGVSPAAKYIGFLTLMLLRRFSFLNYLPINAIQGQGLAKRTIHAGVAKELINRNQDYFKGDQYKDSKDLLSRLLNAAAEERISESELYEQISTFIVAGFESTTTTVGFAAWELARHPEKQARLREELATCNGEPTHKDLQEHLPYLDAVLKETLRLYPGLPYMERVATKADVIPLRQPVKLANGQIAHELFIKPGQTVIIPIIAIQRQDSIWGDADAFRPERWLEPLPPQDELFSGWGNILAFSDGPRSCIGARLAIFNSKVILSALVRHFRFEEPGLDMSLKIASSLQAWVHESKDDPGRNEIPVILHLV